LRDILGTVLGKFGAIFWGDWFGEGLITVLRTVLETVAHVSR